LTSRSTVLALLWLVLVPAVVGFRLLQRRAPAT
jgi:ABC-type molybdate transport system permease subunit